jgi:hypothetical protein
VVTARPWICLAGAILAAACSPLGGRSDSAAPPTAGTTPCPTTAPAFANDRIRKALEFLPLPEGTTLVDEQDFPNVENHPKIDVVVRLCKPGMVDVALKDAATLVGRTLKESPVSADVFSLRVRNAAADTDPRGRVRIDDFESASFDPAGNPEAVREAWKYPDQ